MIILPERGLARGKILMPQRPQEWIASSQRTTVFGIENQTRFRLTARLNDGHVVWRGWFDSREDADEFLLSIVSGSLAHERQLWDLPNETWTPWDGYGRIGWRPDIGENVSYEFVTVTFLTSPTGSNQTYSIPLDWSPSNIAEAIGAGGSGAGGTNNSNCGGPAGGGAYSKSVNLTGLSAGGSATYRIGTGAAGGAAATNGTDGGDSWFNDTALPTTGQAVGAKGGAKGLATSGAGAGGAAAGGYATGTGNVKTSGGAGGTNVALYCTSGAGAAGGAGGTGGAGGVDAGTAANAAAGGGGGADNGSVGTAGTSGGPAGAGGAGANSGGAGGAGATFQGTTAGVSGVAGQEWDSTHGSGGGGGGGGFKNSTGNGTNGGPGGLYGGGSAGGGIAVAATPGTGGTAAQGIVVVTYTPTRTIFNLAFIH
jgi:hypothetical protein